MELPKHVAAARSSGSKMIELCERFEISRKTGYNLLARRPKGLGDSREHLASIQTRWTPSRRRRFCGCRGPTRRGAQKRSLRCSNASGGWTKGRRAARSTRSEAAGLGARRDRRTLTEEPPSEALVTLPAVSCGESACQRRWGSHAENGHGAQDAAPRYPRGCSSSTRYLGTPRSRRPPRRGVTGHQT